MRTHTSNCLLLCLLLLGGCSEHQPAAVEFSTTDLEATLRWLQQTASPLNTAFQGGDESQIQSEHDRFVALANDVVKGQLVKWSGFTVYAVEEQFVEISPQESDLYEFAEFFFVADGVPDEEIGFRNPNCQEDIVPFGESLRPEQAQELSLEEDVLITGEILGVKPTSDQGELKIGVFLKNASLQVN